MRVMPKYFLQGQSFGSVRSISVHSRTQVWGAKVWVPSLSCQMGRKSCVGIRTVRCRQPTNVWDLLKVIYTSYTNVSQVNARNRKRLGYLGALTDTSVGGQSQVSQTLVPKRTLKNCVGS